MKRNGDGRAETGVNFWAILEQYRPDRIYGLFAFGNVESRVKGLPARSFSPL